VAGQFPGRSLQLLVEPGWIEPRCLDSCIRARESRMRGRANKGPGAGAPRLGQLCPDYRNLRRLEAAPDEVCRSGESRTSVRT